ncbi:MAG: hypothetical protein WCY16_11765 [Weeksellaceae bacterium]
MKALFTLLFILSFLISNAQGNVSEKYLNEFGETLILNSDYTFEYIWKFDLASSWNYGKWEIKNEKYIYLTIIEVMDTLEVNGKIELVLSDDKISNKILNDDYVINILSGGGQSRKLPPKKLLIKNEKLYPFTDKNQIQKKKIKSLLNGNQLLKPWFEKSNSKQIENTELKRNENEITGRIINEISLPPHCGNLAFATVFEFEIINSDLLNYNQKSIPLLIKCPEFYGKRFFNKENTYKIKVTDNSQTDFNWTISNLETSKKYNLERDYWVIDIEKL